MPQFITARIAGLKVRPRLLIGSSLRSKSTQPIRCFAAVCIASLSMGGVGGGEAAGQTMTTRSNFLTPAIGQPAMSSTDIEVIVRVLGLGADERSVLEEMYTVYRESIVDDYDRVRSETLDIIEEAMLRNDMEASEEALPIVRAWHKEKAERERTFLDEMTLLLTEEQQSRWSLVERELRRIKDNGGVVSGEGTDIIKLAQIHLGEDAIAQADLGPMLERYSATLDAKLRDRDAYYEDNASAYSDAINDDRARAAELWERMRSKRIAVRDLHAETVRTLVARARAHSPELAESANELEDAWLELTLAYRADPTAAQKQLTSALKLSTLTNSQRAELEALQADTDQQRAGIFRDLVTALFEYEEQLPSGLSSDGTVSSDDEDFQGYESGSRMAKLADRRVNLDRTILRGLRDILTNEQRRTSRGDGYIYAQFTRDSHWEQF